MFVKKIQWDLDVAVVRPVPPIEGFENVDLMPVEMKFQGHGHSAMISRLFDVNTHSRPNSIRSAHILRF
jgi:hypothetical protein